MMMAGPQATGVKRDFNGNVRPETAAATATGEARGQFHDMFARFRDELDEHHDRRERIVKVSRDVTAQSKKIIFALQRTQTLNEELPGRTREDMATRMAEISKLLRFIAPDLQTVNRHRYAGPLRCLEELIEALSFAHYLRHQKLITPTEAQAAIPAEILLTPHDYIFGVFDIFGELMRFATVRRGEVVALAAAQGDAEPKRTILRDIQELSCAFEMLSAEPTKDFRSKMEAMRQSVRKVETLGYGMVVRGSERPAGWVPDMVDDASQRPVSPV